MTLGSAEIYELFLALAPARIAAAHRALALADASERAQELSAALVPLAVDAALLGADGVAALARAAATATLAPPAQLAAALDTLDQACAELGAAADTSGARVDEAQLRAHAAALRQLCAPTALAPLSVPADAPRTPQAGAPARATPAAQVPTPAALAPTPEDPTEVTWVPTLADDMIAAFLDECLERLDGLAERLLALETSGAGPELVNEIFRDLHTLKGSSAFAGLKKMNRVAHLAEDLIGALRDGKRACDRALIDVLLETLDVLRAIVERARTRQPIDVDVRALLQRLRDPSAHPAVAPAPRPAAASPDGSTSASPGPASPAPPTGAAQQATLRIDFAKVDLLMNLVGEAVLARGRLAGGVETQGGLLREVAQIRTRLGSALAPAGTDADAERPRPLAQALEDLQRVERVLHETYDDLESGLGGLTLAVGQLRDNVMKLRMVPISRLFTKYQRTVRELAHKLGKEVRVDLVGAETELDKVLVERLEDPLLHLVRNAVDHGVEAPDRRAAAGKPRTGTVRLMAAQRGGQVIVTIVDDGAGLDPAKLKSKALEKGLLTEAEAAALTDHEAFGLIFRAGFSTAAQLSDVSGRGVGMDVVRDAITKLKGSIHLESQLGRGTTMELRLPLTLALTQVLAARVGGELVALPLDAVVSAQHAPAAFDAVGDRPFLRVGEELIPVIDLGAALGLETEVGIEDLREASVVIVEVGTDRLGLLVRRVLGRHDVVIKSLGPLLAAAPCVAGATLIGDRVLLVVDLAEIAERARQPAATQALAARGRPKASTRARVLIAEDSEVIRETIRRELTEAGFEVRAARDGAEALSFARREQFDAVSTDVMMPELDGYDLTRALRADPRYAHVPIVMVTSKDERLDALRGYDAGADAYLTKPSDAAVLIRTIDALLAKVRAQTS